LVRLPSDFVADVRREAEERGVSLGRVVTERAKWLGEVETPPSLSSRVKERLASEVITAPAWEERKARLATLPPVVVPLAECEHRFVPSSFGKPVCAKCREVKV
jgi:hypothetical protein